MCSVKQNKKYLQYQLIVEVAALCEKWALQRLRVCLWEGTSLEGLIPMFYGGGRLTRKWGRGKENLKDHSIPARELQTNLHVSLDKVAMRREITALLTL